jgi:hypothetical protein
VKRGPAEARAINQCGAAAARSPSDSVRQADSAKRSLAAHSYSWEYLRIDGAITTLISGSAIN